MKEVDLKSVKQQQQQQHTFIHTHINQSPRHIRTVGPIRCFYWCGLHISMTSNTRFMSLPVERLMCGIFFNSTIAKASWW